MDNSVLTLKRYSTNFISFPTLILFFLGNSFILTAFYLRLILEYSALITIPISVFATYLLFPVIHDGSHQSISSNTNINEIISYISGVPFFFAPFPTWRFIHLRHHRYTNIKDKDPDYYVGGGVTNNTELVFRWITHVCQYYYYFFKEVYNIIKKNIRKNFIKDDNCNLQINSLYNFSNENSVKTGAKVLLITSLSIILNLVILYLSYRHHFFYDALILWVIPGAIGIIILSILFDYLPHRFYEDSLESSKYKTTKMTHGIFSTNGKINKYLAFITCNQLTYHNIHHLYPKYPFYVYGRVWEKYKDVLLEKGTEVQSVF